MGVLTVYALFGDDVRLMSDTDDPESTDSMFLGLSSLAFFAFIIEFLMSCFAKPGYLGTIDIQIPGVNSTKFKFSIASFYFWLDIIATVRTTHCPNHYTTKLFGNAARRTASARGTKLHSSPQP